MDFGFNIPETSWISGQLWLDGTLESSLAANIEWKISTTLRVTLFRRSLCSIEFFSPNTAIYKRCYSWIPLELKDEKAVGFVIHLNELIYYILKRKLYVFLLYLINLIQRVCKEVIKKFKVKINTQIDEDLILC